jgi:hypothetical protein
MATITTARILADKALQETCGQECADWAVSMLEQGNDGHYLAILAGTSPPFHHFEIADYRDRALRELGIPDISHSAAVTAYSAERLRLALGGEADLFATLALIKDLCVARDYQPDIYDFYLLYFAYADLEDSEVQWYWEDATRENIVSIIRDRAESFIQSTEAA